VRPSPAPLASIAAALLALTAAACRKEEATEHEPAPLPALPSSPDAAPADHLAEGELLEGTEKAFGLTLPRQVKVDSRFVDLVYASGAPRPDAVANYIRARVRYGTVRIGAANTLFEKVQMPEAPGREISIRVAAGDNGRGCVIEMRDVTPPKPLEGSEVDKWRAVGLSPDGKILDPQHLH
jgi:hypothetical protein